MGTNNLKVKVVELDDAPDYNKEEGWIGIDITDVLVVKNGTVEGNPTVDLKFTDRDGKKYVAMITGGILEMLAGVIKGSKNESS